MLSELTPLIEHGACTGNVCEITIKGDLHHFIPLRYVISEGLRAYLTVWTPRVLGYDCSMEPPTQLECTLVVAISPAQMMTLHQGPPIPVNLPPYLKDLLTRCLSYDPANRPTAAEALEVTTQYISMCYTGVIAITCFP